MKNIANKITQGIAHLLVLLKFSYKVETYTVTVRFADDGAPDGKGTNVSLTKKDDGEDGYGMDAPLAAVREMRDCIPEYIFLPGFDREKLLPEAARLLNLMETRVEKIGNNSHGMFNWKRRTIKRAGKFGVSVEMKISEVPEYSLEELQAMSKKELGRHRDEWFGSYFNLWQGTPSDYLRSMANKEERFAFLNTLSFDTWITGRRHAWITHLPKKEIGEYLDTLSSKDLDAFWRAYDEDRKEAA